MQEAGAFLLSMMTSAVRHQMHDSALLAVSNKQLHQTGIMKRLPRAKHHNALQNRSASSLETVPTVAHIVVQRRRCCCLTQLVRAKCNSAPNRPWCDVVASAWAPIQEAKR